MFDLNIHVPLATAIAAPQELASYRLDRIGMPGVSWRETHDK